MFETGRIYFFVILQALCCLLFKFFIFTSIITYYVINFFRPLVLIFSFIEFNTLCIYSKYTTINTSKTFNLL